MRNEFNGYTLASEAELCNQHPGRNTLIVLPNMETHRELIDALRDSFLSRVSDSRVTSAGLIFKNGSCIRIVANDTIDDGYIERSSYNCVLFDPSLMEKEADKSDLDNFMQLLVNPKEPTDRECEI